MTVEQALAGLPSGWTVFSEVRWPGRARARVDHVVVGPAGVFVIDTTGSAGVAAVDDAALAIASLVPSLPREMFIPLLCLPGDAGLSLAAPSDFGGVVVCMAESLVDHLTGRRQVLSPEWLEFLQFDLDMSTRVA